MTTSPAPLAAARFPEFRRVAAALFDTPPEATLPARIAGAAALLCGARRAEVFVRERDSWVRGGSVGEEQGEDGPLQLPDPLPVGASFDRGFLWIPLETEGEVHGFLGLAGLSEEESAELSRYLGVLLGSVLGASRLSRLVKEAEFEVKTRLLELESLYDLGLSLAGQLDLPGLADEVLFRSISLTDARKGTLVLFREDGSPLLERSVGGEIFPPGASSTWNLPEGEVVVNNSAASIPTSGMRLSSCQKCLAVVISVLGRRLGVLAVADKESRDGGVLDFTPADARLLSLFANQAAAAIETARLHKEALEKERMERELELAAAIQREILPRSLPSVIGVELAAANLPTRQVGGDYFDLFPLSRGRLGFLVADVSGKGIPAALLVSTVHAAVHLQIDESQTIAELVARIDRHLQRYAAARKFLTLFFGLLEPDTGLLRYVSAGHNPGLLARASGSIERLDSTGVPLGIVPHASWREETRQMERGDLLCVYTDGLTEAVNQADEEYGLERLSAALELRRDLPAKRLCDAMLAEVADFAREMPQYDDQTLLLVRRT